MKSGYDKFFKQAKERRVPKSRTRPAAASGAAATKGPLSSNEQVKILRARANERRQQKLRSRFSIPLIPLVIAFTAAGVWGAAGLNLDRVEELLSKVEVKVLGEAEAEGPGKKAPEKAAEGEKSAEAKAESGNTGKEGTHTWTEEELALFKKLDERKKTLDQRERDLGRLEEELQRQRTELDEKLKKLDELREKIGKQLESKIQADGGRVDKLVAFYTNMRPQNAAKIFQEMNEDLAVEILEKMKQKSAAEIMNLLPPDKAQKLTEKFAGYKRR